MANSGSGSRTTAVAVMLLGVMTSIGVVGFTWLAASYGGLDYRCIADGPRREYAPFAVVSEAVQVHGFFSWWPMGRACEWERADGHGFVTAGPGWSATIVFVSCVVIATAGAIVLTLKLHPRSHGSECGHQESMTRP